MSLIIVIMVGMLVIFDRLLWLTTGARVRITIDRRADTSAASVPLALDEAVKDGRIRPGQLIPMEAMGGGFTWGAALVRG